MQTLEDYKHESYLGMLWHRIFRRLIGPFIVKAADPAEYPESELLLTLHIEEGTLGIYFQEYRYMVRFNRWYVKNKSFVLYRFHTVCSNEVNDKLKLATLRDVYFPDIQFRSFSPRQNKNFLLDAYLDVVLHRLKSTNNTVSDFGNLDLSE